MGKIIIERYNSTVHEKFLLDLFVEIKKDKSVFKLFLSDLSLTSFILLAESVPFFLWFVQENDDIDLAGFVYLADICHGRMQINAPYAKKKYLGKKYTDIFAEEFLSKMFAINGLNCLYGIIPVDNYKSIGFTKRNGFKNTGYISSFFCGRDAIVFSMTREDYNAWIIGRWSENQTRSLDRGSFDGSNENEQGIV